MAATAFKGTLVMKNTTTGEVAVQPFTASDITGAYGLFTNNGSNNFVNAPGKTSDVIAITDVALSAAGIDTSQLSLRISAKDTGIALLGAGLVATVNNRMPTPILLRGGSAIMLKQLT